LSIGALYFWFSPPLGEYASEGGREKIQTNPAFIVPPINKALPPLSSSCVIFHRFQMPFLGGRVTKHTIVIRLHGRYGFQVFFA
jgi:hypothetical protein